MTERKSTDVLLSLEAKVTESLGLLRNIDNNLKLLLNQKNVSEQTVKNLQALMPQPTPIKMEAPAVTDPKPPVVVNQAPSVSNSVEAVDFPQIDNPVPVGGPPRTVQEKILYEKDGKIILLAQVEIFQEEVINNQPTLKLVKKTRTNNQGTWTAKLPPGVYKVRVAKQPVQNRPAIAKTYEVRVISGEGPLILESRKL
jgi:hypothetical protein